MKQDHVDNVDDGSTLEIGRDETCLACEYFDCGGEAIASAARESGVPIEGDCLNSWSSPRFQTISSDTCEGWYQNTLLSELDES